MQTQNSEIQVSIIIPAFNEQNRIIPTLNEMIEYFQSSFPSFEIIVVDDGSYDNTAECIRNFKQDKDNIDIVCLGKNSGKGAAVRKGIEVSKGQLLLYMDADGATPISEYVKLHDAITKGADIAIGSRALPSTQTKVTSSLHRICLGRIFNFFANLMAVPEIQDTQCGFKLFKAEAGKTIFSKQKLNGFSFDVEVLFLAHKLGYKVSEVAVNWNNKPGTKINVILDGLKMLRDIFSIKFRHRNL